MYKFVYQNKETGQKVYSNKPVNDKNLKLVMGVKNVVINKPIMAKDMAKDFVKEKTSKKD